DEGVGVVGAHGAAEDDGSGVAGHRVRQRIAKAGTALVERIAAAVQGMADPPRARGLLVHHDQNRLLHRRVSRATRAGSMARSAVVFKAHAVHGRDEGGEPLQRLPSSRRNSARRSAMPRGMVRGNAATTLLAEPGMTMRRPSLSPR